MAWLDGLLTLAARWLAWLSWAAILAALIGLLAAVLLLREK